ncbi:Cytoplasmic protein, partial [Monkeypox virus]
SFNV